MKKKCSKMSDEEGSLCCCEYINHHGEKTHILASCCDCEDLDEACDRSDDLPLMCPSFIISWWIILCQSKADLFHSLNID